MGSAIRTDTQKGAVPSGLLPSWATQALLPGTGTWDNVPGTNVISNLNPIVSEPTASGSGMVDWNQSGIFGLWSGAAFSAAYSQYGAMIHNGGDHAKSQIAQLSNAVLAWNLDTALWEVVVKPWYDTTKLVPNGGTVNWGTGSNWNDGGTSSAWMQTDLTLNSRNEYATGIKGSNHTYNHLIVVPPVWGGSSKGSLISIGAPGGAGTGGASGPIMPDFPYTGNYVHEADLSAKLWRRYCSSGAQEVCNAGSGGLGGYAPICFDSTRGKVYALCYSVSLAGSVSAQNNSGVGIVDCTTKTTTVRPISGAQGLNFIFGNQNCMQFAPHPTDPLQDVVVHWTGTNLIVAWANWIGTGSPGFDSTQGFKNMTNAGLVSGTPIATTGHPGGFGFTFCPDLGVTLPGGQKSGAICQIDKAPGSNPAFPAPFTATNGPTVYMLIIPSDRMNGTWQWTSQQLTKASAGNNAPNDWGYNETWSKFQYAAPAKCFLLCDTEAMTMRMFRPTGLV